MIILVGNSAKNEMKKHVGKYEPIDGYYDYVINCGMVAIHKKSHHCYYLKRHNGKAILISGYPDEFDMLTAEVGNYKNGMSFLRAVKWDEIREMSDMAKRL